MCEIVEAMMIACEMEKKRKLFNNYCKLSVNLSTSCCVFVHHAIDMMAGGKYWNNDQFCPFLI